MATWREIAESEDFQKLSPEEQGIKKLQFFNDVVYKSPKFQGMDSALQDKIFNDMFPNGEYQKTLITQSGKMLWQEWKNLPGIKQGDQVVEAVAKFIEPKVPAGRTTLGLMTKDLPRQVGAEFIRGFQPSGVIPFMGATKAAAPLLKPVGKAIGSKIPTAFKEFLAKEFTIGKGQPLAYQEAAKVAGLERQLGAEEANQVAKTLSTKIGTNKPLSMEEQRYVGRIFRKEVIESPELKAHPKYQELKAISDEGRAVMDKWSAALIKSGIPQKDAAKTIEDNIGSYMARMYRTKLDKTGAGFGVKDLRLRLNGLKQRKDISESILREMGEIKEPALPTAIRVKELSSSVANNKLFTQVAKNPEWVANTNLTGDMVQMPNSVLLGPLKNKWVIKEIGADINAITKAQEQAFPIYNKLLSAWKYGKVVLNPATHARNIMSNTMLLDLSGTSHIDQLRLFPKVVKDYLSQGPLYQQAKKTGAIGGEWVGGEVAKLRDTYLRASGGNLNRWMEAVKIPFKKMGDIYQGEEQISKLIKFAHILEKGGTAELAAKEAQKWLFNYNEIPKFMNIVKQVSPFATFTYKSVPRIAEALVNNPMKVYKYYAFFNGFNEASRKLNGMSPAEYAREQRALPPWLFKSIGGMPANLMMPWKDTYGRSQWLNLEYILPIGLTTEMLQGGAVVSNPILTLFADLSKNKDFKGKDIIPVGASKGEAVATAVKYIYKQMMPTWTPGIGELKGGYSFEKLMDAASKKPDFADRVRSVPVVLFDTLAGLKLTPVDVNEAEAFRMSDKKRTLDELRKQALRYSHPAVSDKEREKGLEDIFRKMQKVVNE